MSARDPRQRITENPFYVLGLSVACSRAEVEREGQKLLGMLELGLSSARVYQTPLGPCERSADKVREAMAELRDPERRLLHELWARASVGAVERDASAPAEGGDAAGWAEARASLGWRRR